MSGKIIIVTLVCIASAAYLLLDRSLHYTIMPSTETRATDSFDGADIDVTKWAKWENDGGRVHASQGKLHIDFDAGGDEDVNSGIAYTHSKIQGNFSADIDVYPINTDNKDTGALNFFFATQMNGGTVTFVIARVRKSTQDSIVTGTWRSDGDLWQRLSPIRDLPGGTGVVRLRIVRRGSTFRSYYTIDNTFILFGSWTDGPTGEGQIKLGGWKRGSHPSVNIAVDNFTLSTDQ